MRPLLAPLVPLLVLAACDSATSEERAAGTYSVVTYEVVDAGVARDLVADGTRFDVVLTGDGRFTSDLTVVYSESEGPPFAERTSGTYRVRGAGVEFETEFASAVLGLDWRLEGPALRTDGAAGRGPRVELRRR